MIGYQSVLDAGGVYPEHTSVFRVFCSRITLPIGSLAMGGTSGLLDGYFLLRLRWMVINE